MITLRINNIYSYFNGIDPIYEKELDELFAKYIENYWHSTKFRKHLWDGKIHFYKLAWHSFPTGLLDRVQTYLKNRGLSFYVNDKRTFQQIDFKNIELKEIELRDYQKEAIEDALTRGSGILSHAMNAGKTESACAIIQAINQKTLWLTNKKKLLHQTAERIELRTGIEVGKVGDGLKEDGQVVVAIVQNFLKMPDKELKVYLKQFEVLIVDECHHLGGSMKTFYRVAMRCPARYRYGLSATPLQDKQVKDWRLYAALGEIISVVSNKELIDQEISAKPTIRMFEVDSDVDETLNYVDAYQFGIVNNYLRNGIIIDETKKIKLSTLILVRLKDHGRLLKKLFSKEGTESEFISGPETTEFIDDAINRFEAGTLKVLISTNILNEGVDISAIRHLVIAAGGGGDSHIEVVQRIGRGLRRKDGANELTVTDFYDRSNKHLRKHSRNRIADYEKEEFEVEVERVE